MIAILSDIHGNLPALEAVIAEATSRGCTQFINLGDIVSGPLWPRETADLLMRHDWLTIAGNHERQLLSGDPTEMGESDRHARGLLDERHLRWLAGLPVSLQWRPDVFLCHANPEDDMHYLMHRVEPERIREQIEQIIGLDARGALPVSAKQGSGVHEVLEAIVHLVPPPKGDPDAPLRARLAAASARICDGLGAGRVADAFLARIAERAAR